MFLSVLVRGNLSKYRANSEKFPTDRGRTFGISQGAEVLNFGQPRNKSDGVMENLNLRTREFPLSTWLRASCLYYVFLFGM